MQDFLAKSGNTIVICKLLCTSPFMFFLSSPSYYAQQIVPSTHLYNPHYDYQRTRKRGGILEPPIGICVDLIYSYNHNGSNSKKLFKRVFGIAYLSGFLFPYRMQSVWILFLWHLKINTLVPPKYMKFSKFNLNFIYVYNFR